MNQEDIEYCVSKISYIKKLATIIKTKLVETFTLLNNAKSNSVQSNSEKSESIVFKARVNLSTISQTEYTIIQQRDSVVKLSCYNADSLKKLTNDLRITVHTVLDMTDSLEDKNIDTYLHELFIARLLPAKFSAEALIDFCNSYSTGISEPGWASAAMNHPNRPARRSNSGGRRKHTYRRRTRRRRTHRK